VVEAYSDNMTWITYGNFIHWKGGNDLIPGFAMPPEGGIKNIRNARWTTTHLRTWKAGLFKNIKKEDLQYEGEFVTMAGDVFFMCAMLEMAGESRSKYLKDISYVYNISTPDNEYKVNMELQNKMANYARSKVPYKEIISCY
jgi:hypothetical protein